MSKQALTRAVPLVALLLTACGGGGTSTGNPIVLTEDTSSSGAAAASIGGALSSTSANGTQASSRDFKSWKSWMPDWLSPFPEALASTLCPTYRTANASGCSENSTDTIWLIEQACNFAHGSATWYARQALTKSTGTATCGSLPVPGANGNLKIQYVDAPLSNTSSVAYIDSSYGVRATIDDSQNLSDYDSQSITPFGAVNGYGAEITWTNGKRTSIQIAHRITTPASDETVAGSVNVNETAPDQRTVSGMLTVYHNLLKVTGTTTFNGLIHSDACCLPTGGTITTTFANGINVSPSTKAGQNMVGKTETLTLTGCGTGILEATDGTTTDVSLSRCF